MTHILMNTYKISNPHYLSVLQKYIKPSHKICVVPFSFRESDIPSDEVWQKLYSEKNGIFRKGLVSVYEKFGISETQIEYIDYFTDTQQTAKKMIQNADVLYFTGGLPDKMYERLDEFGLIPAIQSFDGIVMGDSAGAVIQFDCYHLSPDRDYPDFSYYEGLHLLTGFQIEVHYENQKIQNESIQKVIAEKKVPVYAMPDDSILICENSSVVTLGDVKFFPCEE
ncbi:MAG: peptidase E [Eubacterium sp.]|nr:peptidase E [Eubacterium sp.]